MFCGCSACLKRLAPVLGDQVGSPSEEFSRASVPKTLYESNPTIWSSLALQLLVVQVVSQPLLDPCK